MFDPAALELCLIPAEAAVLFGTGERGLVCLCVAVTCRPVATSSHSGQSKRGS
jgi:hypothetical protein